MDGYKRQLASRLAKANPISLLGQQLRHVDFPEPSIPRREPPVVIPGGPKPRPRLGGIPASKI